MEPRLPPPRPGQWKERAAHELRLARSRMEALLAPLSEAQLRHQHSKLMSPLVWDVAHVANYEEQWLLRALGERALAGTELDKLYDAFAHPRSTRARLEILGPGEAFRYARDVRARALEHLDRVPEDSEAPLLRAGFVFGMVAQHEQQHIETLLATLQLMDDGVYAPPCPSPFQPRAGSVARKPGDEVFIPAGPFQMGTEHPWAFDNERGVHQVDLPAYFIDRHPVSNADFCAFIEEGGYSRKELWSPQGWRHRREAGLEHPLFWRRAGAGWERRRFALWEALPPDEPVQHVCFFEAEAYARWRGRRLPTEAEWEKAAASGPSGASRLYPWGDETDDTGRANLGQRRLSPAPVGRLHAGASAWGVEQLLGDVWEWTSSDFRPYPGFQAFPYREYSEVFFGKDYKVLRGGAWGVAPVTIRTTFRNWDYPIRRQIFAGLRCARDA